MARSLEEALRNHVHYLSSTIGPRPLGSPSNQVAADYIAHQFQSMGLQVEEQEYPCTAWEHASTCLEWAGESFPAQANAYSLPCDVTSTLVAVSTRQELEQASVDGRILLVYGHLASSPLSPKSWFLLSEQDKHVIELLETKRPAALLSPPTATDYFNHWTEDAGLDLPTATIPIGLALRLLQDPQIPVHLQISARRSPAIARNIVARSPRQERKLVLMAHFDTKINTPGATDNAGGVAILLALAELLSARPTGLGLEFVAFNGEEYLPMGDDEYLRRGEGEFPSIFAAVNFDGAGATLGTNTVTAMGESEEFAQHVRALLSRQAGMVWVDPWPESNHSTFSFRGVPVVAFSASGTRSLAHSTSDTFDQVSPGKLFQVLQFILDLISSWSG